jgi:hypothetical protein
MMPKKERAEKFQQPYSDDDPITILSDAPTHANAVKRGTIPARFWTNRYDLQMGEEPLRAS